MKWPLLLLAPLALLACSEEERGGGEDDRVELTLDNYCYAYHEALCQRQVGCNVALNNQATSVEACIQEASRLCAPRLETWKRSVETGAASFSAELLRQCRGDLEQTDCKALAAGRRPESCRAALDGDAQEGEGCFTDVECAGTLICAAFGRCPGQCQALPDDPEQITCQERGCSPGEFCDGAVCQAQRAQGEACPNRDDACQGDLYCGKTAQDANLLCRAPLPEGEPCFGRGQCQSGLSCHITGQTSSERSCLPAKAQGDTCADSDECSPGLICDSRLGTCGPPKAEQEVCASTLDCQSGLYCWQAFEPEEGLGRCREQNKVGVGQDQPCHPSTDRCRLGLYCRIDGDDVELGSCQVLPDLGEPCADFSRNLNEECRSGACVPGGTEPLCVELLEAGQPCERGAQCLSTSCQEGACAPFEAVFCSP